MLRKRTVKTLREERMLTARERQWHLLAERQAAKPHACDRVIRMNSTYLEMVDGGYKGRGAISATGLVILCIELWFIFSIWGLAVSRLLDSHRNHEQAMPMFSALFLMTTICLLPAIGITWLSRSTGEWFRYTHYPIRFNRKRRTVHVFRGDGTVLEGSWDKIYFTLHESKKVGGMTWLGISGLVLKDPQTVEEQFTFGYSSTSIGNCQRHWEFVRRYMQHGPQAVMHAEGITYCLPIADKKETPYQAWIELLSTMGTSTVLRIVMMPFLVAFFIGRMFANATSKVPLWPADVEAACLIDANDPYVRDSRSNPEGYR